MPMTSVSVGREAVKGALLSACQSLLHLLQERSNNLSRNITCFCL